MNTEEKGEKLLTFGAALIALSILGLIGWLGAGEVDCYYTSEVFAQYRYCGAEYIGNEKSLNYTVLATCIVIFAVGVVIYNLGHKLSGKKNKRK